MCYPTILLLQVAHVRIYHRMPAKRSSACWFSCLLLVVSRCGRPLGQRLVHQLSMKLPCFVDLGSARKQSAVSSNHLHISFITCVSCHNFWTKYFYGNYLFNIHAYIYSTEAAGIALLPPCSLRWQNRGNRQTGTHTHTQTNYSNPHCASAPRVKKCVLSRDVFISNSITLSASKESSINKWSNMY